MKRLVSCHEFLREKDWDNSSNTSKWCGCFGGQGLLDQTQTPSSHIQYGPACGRWSVAAESTAEPSTVAKATARKNIVDSNVNSSVLSVRFARSGCACVRVKIRYSVRKRTVGALDMKAPQCLTRHRSPLRCRTVWRNCACPRAYLRTMRAAWSFPSAPYVFSQMSLSQTGMPGAMASIDKI